jgi:hypothetical protein
MPRHAALGERNTAATHRMTGPTRNTTATHQMTELVEPCGALPRKFSFLYVRRRHRGNESLLQACNLIQGAPDADQGR